MVGRFEAGRICLEPACDTRLSIYNASPSCSLHEARLLRPSTTGFDRAAARLARAVGPAVVGGRALTVDLEG